MKFPTPTELDAEPGPPPISQYHITQPKNESLSNHIQVDSAPIVRTFYDQHEKHLVNIHKSVQTVWLVNGYHAQDIDMLAEAAVKHYLYKTEHNFKAEELDLSNILSKQLKRPFLNGLNEQS